MVSLVFLHFATTTHSTVISNSEKVTHPNIQSIRYDKNKVR